MSSSRGYINEAPPPITLDDVIMIIIMFQFPDQFATHDCSPIVGSGRRHPDPGQ